MLLRLSNSIFFWRLIPYNKSSLFNYTTLAPIHFYSIIIQIVISKSRLLQLLQVRQTEWWLVRQLFFQQFFSGAGIALFFTAAFSWFLQKFSIQELPKVLFTSAFILWATGFMYGKLEHTIPLKRLILYLNLFIAISMVVFWMLLPLTNSIWFYFAMLVWYNVLYLLNSLDFWGLASLLFDVRQSKRLFGLISAGDIPAKFIGYASAVVIVPFLGAHNLLLIGALLVLISLRYWYRLNKNGHLNVEVSHQHAANHSSGENLKQVVKNFFQNNLVFHMAILSFLIMSTFTIINFTFYAEVKNKLTHNAMLATYIGLFLAFSRGVAIIVKLFFTNRIINYLGITKSLLITPIILSLLFIPVFIMQLMGVGNLKVLLVFGLLSIINDVLRSAIQTPVFLTVMQPLQASVRLKAHNILKGIMDPFAFFFCGMFLYLMIDLENFVDLNLLSYLLTVLLFLSIVWVFIIDKEYVKALVLAVQNRYLNRNETNLQDASSLEFLVQKMKFSNQNEALVILSLIKDLQPTYITILENALLHEAMPVQYEAVKICQKLHAKKLLPQIEQVASNTPHIDLKSRCITAIYALTDNVAKLNWHNEMQWQVATITGMLSNERLKTDAQNHLQAMFRNNTQTLIAALNIVYHASNTHFSNEVLIALHSDDEAVLKAAIKASGIMHHKDIVHRLIDLFKLKKHTSEVIQSLHLQGGAAIKQIAVAINEHSLSINDQKKLIAVIAKADPAYSIPVLVSMVSEHTPLLHDLVFSLYLQGYKSPAGENIFLNIIEIKFLNAATLISHQQYAILNKNQLLQNALSIELADIRTQLLYMFTFFYNTENIMRIKHAFVIDKPTIIANAIEVADVSLNKEHAQKFIVLFDLVGFDIKQSEVQKIFKQSEDLGTPTSQILNDTHHLFNNWTKTITVYTLNNHQVKHYATQLQLMLQRADALLHQTIVYKLQSV